MTDRRKIKDAPVVEVRVEPNRDGTFILWRVTSSDGTKANGYAKSPGDAMHDAAAFVEAMMQPRRGGMWIKPSLRVVGGEPVEQSSGEMP